MTMEKLFKRRPLTVARCLLCAVVFAEMAAVSSWGDTPSGVGEGLETLSRKKRFIVWEPWGLSWVQLVAGIGLPIEIEDQSITIGSVFKAYYILPNNASQLVRPTVTVLRKKRSSASRWMLYEAFEKYMETFGHDDGKVCLMKAICEASSSPFEEKSGLLAEVMHVLLTPSSTDEPVDKHSDSEYHAAEKLGKEGGNCELLFPECAVNFMSQFTRFLF